MMNVGTAYSTFWASVALHSSSPMILPACAACVASPCTTSEVSPHAPHQRPPASARCYIYADVRSVMTASLFRHR